MFKERATAAWWATAKAREREWVRAKGRVYARERINEVREGPTNQQPTSQSATRYQPERQSNYSHIHGHLRAVGILVEEEFPRKPVIERE